MINQNEINRYVGMTRPKKMERLAQYKGIMPCASDDSACSIY